MPQSLLMVYPIVAYGSPVLKRVAQEVDATAEETKQFIEDLFETMYAFVAVDFAALAH